jgi:hypothetical protein
MGTQRGNPSYVQNQQAKDPTPILAPDIAPLNPLLGLVPTMPKKLKFKDAARTGLILTPLKVPA